MVVADCVWVMWVIVVITSDDSCGGESYVQMVVVGIMVVEN